MKTLIWVLVILMIGCGRPEDNTTATGPVIPVPTPTPMVSPVLTVCPEGSHVFESLVLPICMCVDDITEKPLVGWVKCE